MKSGDVFTVDEQAITDTARFFSTNEDSLREKFGAGTQFIVAKNEKCDGDTVRASYTQVGEDGEVKARRGRPRPFPRGVVQRLLGEPVDTPVQSEDESGVDTEEETSSESLEAEAEALLSGEPSKGGDEGW